MVRILSNFAHTCLENIELNDNNDFCFINKEVNKIVISEEEIIGSL